jgi:hypothetical protein
VIVVCQLLVLHHLVLSTVILICFVERKEEKNYKFKVTEKANEIEPPPYFGEETFSLEKH